MSVVFHHDPHPTTPTTMVRCIASRFSSNTIHHILSPSVIVHRRSQMIKSCYVHSSYSNIVKRHRSSPVIVCQLSADINRLSQYQWATLGLQPSSVATININYNCLSPLNKQPSTPVTASLLLLLLLLLMLLTLSLIPECSNSAGHF